MPLEAPLVVTYGSRLSASTPCAMVKVPDGAAAAGCEAVVGCAAAAVVAAGAVVGFGAAAVVGAAVAAGAAGAVVGFDGAAVGCAGAAGEHAASTLAVAPRPRRAPPRMSSRRVNMCSVWTSWHG